MYKILTSLIQLQHIQAFCALPSISTRNILQSGNDKYGNKHTYTNSPFTNGQHDRQINKLTKK